MLTGRDPGELGIYGFRERVAHGYGMQIASAEHVRVPWVWEHAARAGKRSAALFAPPSYPPRATAEHPAEQPVEQAGQQPSARAAE